MANVSLVAGNQLSLLQNGAEYFPQLASDIEAAQHSVFLETYIFEADQIGSMISAALQRAARRGVKVRVMLDGFGSAELPQVWAAELATAGVELQWFRPEISPFTLQRNRRRRLRRLHRKLAAIDDAIAYVGGINIIDDIPRGGNIAAPRLDYAVRVEGLLAHEVTEEMRHLWGVVKWATLRRRIGRMRAQLRRKPHQTEAGSLQFLLRDNLRHRRDIERAYLQAIAAARSEVIIANAYFLPGRPLRQALKAAAARGVRVVLLLQGRVEHRLQHYATLALYGQLLEDGIELYQYHHSFLHAKVGVVDGDWATVGSSNLDPFSLLLAREANLVVRDTDFSGALRGSLLQAIQSGGRRVGHATLPPLTLLLARLSYGLIRLLMNLFAGLRQ
ncbi:MAG: cardiolipin synthase ClsB [Gallionella sp.]|nr:cardiolipin synthase ClsB [Gallionella sp.]MDD4946376.1 cardiolipin synthase ClsB [Gallionella sp.]MDD5611732.1 cardiolipin synthase ClsB [Gallionella sp.]